MNVFCDLSTNEEVKVGASIELTDNFLCFKNAKHTNTAREFSYGHSNSRPLTSNTPGGVAQTSEPHTIIVLLWALPEKGLLHFTVRTYKYDFTAQLH